jgi:hypothetical protein
VVPVRLHHVPRRKLASPVSAWVDMAAIAAIVAAGGPGTTTTAACRPRSG